MIGQRYLSLGKASEHLLKISTLDMAASSGSGGYRTSLCKGDRYMQKQEKK